MSDVAAALQEAVRKAQEVDHAIRLAKRSGPSAINDELAGCLGELALWTRGIDQMMDGFINEIVRANPRLEVPMRAAFEQAKYACPCEHCRKTRS